MSSLAPAEIELLGRNWPDKVIDRYDDYFQIWRSQFKERIAPSTETHYTAFAKAWCPFANGKNLTPALMIDWHLHLSQHQSSFRAKRHGRFIPISVDRVIKMHTILKKFLGWLKLVGVITHDPSVALPQLKEAPRQARKLYLHDEYLKIIRWASGRDRVEPLLFLCILGYETGMSLKDCCYLHWDEVVMREDGPSYISKPRSKLASRLGAKAVFTVPMIPGGHLWVWMKRLESRRDRNYQRKDGKEFVHQELPGLYEQVKPRIAKVLRRDLLWPALGGPEGLKDRTFRHFRNSFCSRLINAGVDSLLVSKMTGHTNLAQLSEYVLPNLRAMQDALLKAQRWAEGEAGPDIPQFLTLPSPSVPVSSAGFPSPTSLAGLGERQQ